MASPQASSSPPAEGVKRTRTYPAPVNRPPPRPRHGRANPACPYPIPPTYLCSSFYSDIYFFTSPSRAVMMWLRHKKHMAMNEIRLEVGWLN